jgi:hypothetical protein
VTTPDLIAQIDMVRERRAADADREVLAAGFRTRPASVTSQSGSGFESGGVLDTSEPSAMLAGLADAATRDGALAELYDDELIGVIRAWRRIESWSNGGLLVAIAELARRRPADRTPAAARGQFPAQLSEFIGDEIAAALTLSARTADTYLDLALDLATRLPGTAQALRSGVIDYPKARLIAEATRILTDADARAVEALVLPDAGWQTLGQLRAALSRAVLAVDPDAATRRREEAQKDPRVRRWQEDAGTAALAGFGLPPAAVLEADQRLTARAQSLRDAGLSGSLDDLRARAYLDTLLGQDSVPPSRPAPEDCTPAQSSAPAHPGPSDYPNSNGHPGPSGRRHPSGPAGSGAASIPMTPTKSEPAQRRLAAQLNLTVPLTTLLGLAATPGHIVGFGPLDAPLARDLAELAANHPASRYCLTVTGDDGHPLGHGCARGRPPSLSLRPATGSGPAPPPPRRPGSFTVTINPLAQDPCDHRHQEPGYKPSRQLRHLIWTRNPTCSAPGCRRPAAQCDLDHTVPYDQGGRTCECDLAPLCRHHHRCKQSEGWRLEQPSPGVMRWTTPAGRRYLIGPSADAEP